MSHAYILAPVHIPATIIRGKAVELRFRLLNRDTRQPEALTSPFPVFELEVRRPEPASPDTFTVTGTPDPDQAANPGCVDFVLTTSDNAVAGLHEADALMDDRPLQPGRYTWYVSPSVMD